MSTVDDLDRKILTLLQRDGRMTNAAIGAEVGLSAPSVFERVRKLEQRGIIRGYAAHVDPAALGKPMTAFIRVTIQWDERYDAGLRALAADPDVLDLYSVAGEDCLILKTKVAGPSELEGLIGRIRTRVNVQRSVTMIALSAFKEDAPIDLGPAAAPAAPRRKRDLGKGRK